MIPNKVERDLVYVFKGVFMRLQIKTSFESANVLIIFILPTTEGSLWNHIFNVFFKDPNLSIFFSFQTILDHMQKLLPKEKKYNNSTCVKVSW